jgi:hypothetical protein
MRSTMHYVDSSTTSGSDEDEDPVALVYARQYWALAELIAQFGTALLAFDDMEDAESDPELAN